MSDTKDHGNGVSGAPKEWLLKMIRGFLLTVENSKDAIRYSKEIQDRMDFSESEITRLQSELDVAVTEGHDYRISYPLLEQENKALTNANEELRERLRWRKWPDEKPESWPVLVVDTLGCKAVIYKIERVACTDGTDPMCWIADTGYIRADICPSWLPIPPSDKGEHDG